MKKLEFHPALKDVPLMLLHERDALRRDIVENGQRFPILTIGGKIIDGRNRYLACLAGNIEPKVVELTLQDPKKFIASANYFRKHWTTAERAHFAALMSLESEEGSPETKPATLGTASNEAVPSVRPVITQDTAAKQMGVSRSSVQRAKSKIQGKSKPTTKRNGQIVDSMNFPVPAEAMAYWNRKSEVQDILTHISKARSLIAKISDGDPLFHRISSVQKTKLQLDELYNQYKGVLPSHVCAICDGVKVDGCKACVGTGVISEYVWDRLSKEQRAKRGMEQPF